MTSKNLFIKLMKEDSKRRIAVIALSILAMFLALPIYGALSVNIWMGRLEVELTKYEDIISSFSVKVIGMENPFLVALVLLFGVLIGINGFSYLFSKQKTDLYHSIPVRRDTMFFVSYINGILYFAVPYAVMLAFTLIMGKMYGLVNGTALATAVTAYFITMLCYIMIYSTAILASMLTGNVIISILATGTFFAYGPIVKVLYWGYHEIFFWGFYSYPTMLDDTRYYSPIALYSNIVNAVAEHTATGTSLIIEAAIVTIILAVLSMIIYRKRPSEAAGRAIAFPKLCPFIKFLIIIPAALASGIFFRELVTTGSQKDIWFGFGIIFALVLAHAVMEIIFRFDFKAAVKNMPHLILAFVITAVIAAIFRFDILRYSSYVPKTASIASIGMEIGILNTGNTYYNLDSLTEDLSDSEFYNFIYRDVETYLLENIKLTDIETCLALAENGIEYTQKVYSSRDSRFRALNQDTSDEYDTHRYSYITYCYHLKNGENVYRRYYVDLTENIDLLNQIYSSNEFKEVAYPVLTFSDSSLERENFDYYSPLGAYTLKNLTDEEFKELLETYQKELRAQDFSSLFETYPIGHFACRKNLKNSKVDFNMEYNQGYVFPSFKETVALLEKYKIPIYDYMDIDNIASINITYYNYDDFESSTKEKTYTDKEVIATFMESLVPSDNFYATGLSQSFAFDGNLDIEVIYKDTPKGFVNSCHFELPPDSVVPEKIKKDFNYYE